ncbi:MAG: alpha/beta hydrolase [Roseateles depolymerans]|uniref:Alpha/beta hydrolase n=1 Tax=Roseateles depolymerans TaxID=76731 RepID=A0A2W5DBL4_9BURK|nr:MAG: alpha/beta hydrolase [Roseateles depolymerans]
MQVTHRIPVDGAELAVEYRPGPADRAPLVCLHAGVTDSRLWDGVAAAAQGWRPLLRLDRRGFGQTRVVDARPHRLIDDLRSALDAVGLSQPLELLGCSQGGRVAIDFALAWPERVAGLTLVAPAVGGAPDEALDPASQVLADALEAAQAAGGLDEVNRLHAHLWLDGPAQAEGRVAGAARALFLAMNQTALQAPPAGELLLPPEAWPRLEALALPGRPLRLLCGSLDLPLMLSRCRQIARRWPQASFAELQGVAHLPSLEAPARFNALLAEAGLLPGRAADSV